MTVTGAVASLGMVAKGSLARMPALTIAVASHQRRVALLRLLDALARAIEEEQAAGDVEVVVVLDGSDDGSREALGVLSHPAPLHVRWQPNAGLAAARNAGWRAAGAPAVWFLDDDLVPTREALRAHLAFHEGRHGEVLSGPCVHPADLPTVVGSREFYEERYRRLADAGAITDREDFGAANASLPVAVLTAVGGFEERFRRYGIEDYELAHRLLRAGVPLRFDPAAVVWHEQRHTVVDRFQQTRQESGNRVVLAELHPELAAELFPPRPAPTGLRGAFERATGDLLLRSLPGYRLLARVLALAARIEAALGRRPRAFHVADAVHSRLGVAEADPSRRYLMTVLHRDDHAA
jgi:GT2 family glycosyltransferase